MNSIPRNGLRVVSADFPPAELVEVHVLDLLDGPTAQELADLEAESPVIVAGLDVLDVEIALIDRTSVSEFDARRLRRARRRLIAAELAVYGLATDMPSLRAVA
ncbi:DUF6284 family protein [Longispora sp. NPDC051575]|uniref:DUF6284 family protein n=1 Tax=Longispora sp. NPDC051575 TaxID=3154943 RepID=UPI0034199707